MRTLVIILLLLGCAPSLPAQTPAVGLRDEVKDGTFKLWIQNNLPCHSEIYARAPSQHRKFHQSVPKRDERVLVNIPVDSIQNVKQFKDNLEYNFILGNYNAVPDPRYRYLLPYPRGISHRLIQGYHGEHTHNTPGSMYAYDFEMREGSYVTAARGGVVGFLKEDNTEGGEDKKLMDKVNLIMICHDDGTVGIYAHLKYKGALVDIGDHVFAGEVIGFSGNTGFSTGPHLHFSVMVGDRSVPIRFRNLPDTLVAGQVYKQELNF